MISIPPSAVEDAWQEIYGEGDEAQVQILIDQFQKEQPILLAFLASLDSELPDSDDHAFVFLYGVWAWLAFKKAGRDDRAVTEEQMIAAYEANENDMLELQASSEATYSKRAKEMTSQYRQMPLLAAMLDDIMDGEIEDPKKIDDISGIVTLHVKSVIDALGG